MERTSSLSSQLIQLATYHLRVFNGNVISLCPHVGKKRLGSFEVNLELEKERYVSKLQGSTLDLSTRDFPYPNGEAFSALGEDMDLTTAQSQLESSKIYNGYVTYYHFMECPY